MKFLCTKVKELWLTIPKNREQVINTGLAINGSFIGIEIKDLKPSPEEEKFVSNAVLKLFDNHIKAFPVRLMDL